MCPFTPALSTVGEGVGNSFGADVSAVRIFSIQCLCDFYCFRPFISLIYFYTSYIILGGVASHGLAIAC